MKIASLNQQCQIEIVYVVDYSKSKNDILHAQGKEELEFSRRKKLTPVEELLSSKDIPYKVSILRGEPGLTIITYVNANGYDLVIIGSRGLNSLQEMVLGSVSHKIVKRVNCPY